jgi:hypothetical protein
VLAVNGKTGEARLISDQRWTSFDACRREAQAAQRLLCRDKAHVSISCLRITEPAEGLSHDQDAPAWE